MLHAMGDRLRKPADWHIPCLNSLFSAPKMSCKNGNWIDERDWIEAPAFGGCLCRMFACCRIGAGANARRNFALRDGRIGQHARSEYSGLDARGLCGESLQL